MDNINVNYKTYNQTAAVPIVTRVGIYGGSFNPIHNGHIETAEFLLKNNYVDTIRFLLNPKSPFKLKDKMPDPYFRGKMVQLATDAIRDKYGRNKAELDETEMIDNARGETCYTVGTLKKLLYGSIWDRDCPKEFILIIGTDIFNSIKKFKGWEWFLETKLVKFIILPRGGYTIDTDLLREFDELIIKVDYTNFNPIELSSSEIRESIKKSEYTIINGKISTKVWNYIVDNKLYIDKNYEKYV